MKRLLLTLLLAASPLICAAGVSVNINLGSPGYYGPVDIVGAPSPALVYTTPAFAVQGPAIYPPLYLRVPVYYYQNWPRYCHYYSQYNACVRPVYFIQDGWYRNTYVNYYRHRHSPVYYQGGRDYGRRDYDRRYYDSNRVVIDSGIRPPMTNRNQIVIQHNSRHDGHRDRGLHRGWNNGVRNGHHHHYDR